MARTVYLAVVVAAVAVGTGPVSAQSSAIRAAHAAYTSGDLAGAERTLTAELRIFPSSPEALINLAAVYARTGRTQQAAALYRQVLSRRDVTLDLDAERTASSHMLAQAGLRRVSALQTAAR